MDGLNELLNAVGSLAEISSLFYTGLLQNGVEKEAAVQLTVAFITSMAKGGNNHGQTE